MRRSRARQRIAGLAAGVAAATVYAAAFGQSAPIAPPGSSPEQPASADDAQPPQLVSGISDQAPPALDLWSAIARRSNLLGTMGGLRTALGQYGMTLSLTETSEVLGNLTGGIRQGFEYDGLTTATLQLDTQRAFNWYGGTFNVSALQIHGRNLSADNLDTLQTASGIEADRATRLWELWYQQKFASGAADVKLGQQSLDQEFIVSQNALLFVNTMFGWPMVPSADLPGGGPAYPLSALGVRLRTQPTPGVTVLAGVFNGSPSPDNSIPDAQQADPSGTSFPLNGGALAITELQITSPAVGGMVPASETRPLSGTYKIGFWYDTEQFADLRYDNTGLPLADPASTGMPLQHHGDYSIYGVIDQMVWQSTVDDSRILSVFGRAMGTPESDRNLVDFSLNAGLTLKDPLPDRPDDTFGAGLGFAHVSARRAGYDTDVAYFNPGVYSPAQGSETFIELTYQYQVTPWWQLQPDFQYVFNPSGGIPNPNNPTRKIGDEAVIGLRTNITF
ncbi:MAG TPA: carbohydrate porin [Stellaceae bacterium]|nr:carbohydrate porin [Stellaceae bacterium]